MSDEPKAALMNEKQLYMVFDVESIGLHGEGFAVGFVVIDREERQHDSGLYACLPQAVHGSEEGHLWVRSNIPKLRYTNDAPWQVRTAFWNKWLEWKARNAVLVADCAWPVEARFLARCVDDNPVSRECHGPYPLHDLASILLAAGKDPLAKTERKHDELPEHNPLCDARQSARILIQTLKA